MKFNILYLHLLGFLASQFPVKSSSDRLSDVRVNEPLTRNRRSTTDSSVFYYQDPQYPRDCQEVYEQCEEETESGIYMIQPEGAPEPFNVHCNNSIDGGKWTVFQRRLDGSVDFYRNWEEYKKGFGFLNREFWLGNDKLAFLTAQKDYELRIDMTNVNGAPYFAKYDLFRISDEWSKYRMVDLGQYLSESTAGYDAIGGNYPSRNMSFSTYDRDNDKRSDNCASHSNYRGAWWYHENNCGYVNLNGPYFDCSGCNPSVWWHNLPGSAYNIKYVEMKVRAR